MKTKTTDEQIAVIDTDETQYTVMVPSKEGHGVQKTLGLEQTIDYLFELFKNNKMWISVNSTLFNPEATFSGSDADNRKVTSDRDRLRRLILDNTQKGDGAAAIVPDIAALGRPVGGGTALTPSLFAKIQKVKANHKSASAFLADKGVPARDIPVVLARYKAKLRAINSTATRFGL